MLKGFSSSAPRISLEAVRAEVDALSQQEQKYILDDIHGRQRTTAVPAETEELMNKGLRALEECIEAIPAYDRECYNRAVIECPDHASDQAFRLRFLRCESFDAQKAAARLVAYWRAKVDVFSIEHAFRPITLADFVDDNDQHALQMGGIRCLPVKDEAGRAIILIDRTRFDQRVENRKSMLKLNWYMHHVALEDDQVQRKGIVYIVGFPRRVSTLLEQDRKFDSFAFRHVKQALPVHVAGVHNFCSSRLLEFFIPIYLFLAGPAIRARYRLHMGQEEDFLTALDEYGIKLEALPLDMGGTSDFDYAEWLEQRRAMGR